VSAGSPSQHACPECRIAAGPAPPDLAVLRRGPFVVHRKPEAAPVPGWLIVAPIRHVEQIDALAPAELTGLGPLLAETAAALRAETPCEKVYVSVFAEALPHLHFHVIARPPGLPAEERGPRLLLAEGRVDAGVAESLARRAQARLAAPPAASSRPLRALLLSALVCPGAGQLHNRDYVKGTLLVGASVLSAGAFVWKTVADALRLLPDDPSDFGLLQVFALAEEVRRRNADSFLLLTVVLVLLWGYSVYDAWRRMPQR
jgi:diadenosine tetraphosphate (Ap4A) HIT family hydrolase